MLTTTLAFATATSLAIDALVTAVLTQTGVILTPAQVAWFTAYCDRKFRKAHASDSIWREWLENRNPRINRENECKLWIRHWLTAYKDDPSFYHSGPSKCPECGSNEWYQCHSDGFVWHECDDCDHKIITKRPPEYKEQTP